MRHIDKIIYKTPFAAIIYILSILLIHPFYEEGATPSRVSTLKALFFPAITDWPLNQIFISDFFALLYQKHSSIPWYGIIELSLILLALLFTYNVLSKLKNPLILFIFLAVSIDDILLMSFTRTATLFLTLGPSLLFLEINKVNFKLNLKSSIYISLVFILIVFGFLNKPYAASFALTFNCLFFITYIFLLPNKVVKTLKTITLVLIPILATFMLIFFTYIKLSSPDQLKAINYSSVFYNLNSADSYKDNLSPKDSIGILMLENNFISDRSYYNNEFIERVTRNPNKKLIDFKKFFDEANYKKLKTKYIPLIIKNHKIELIVLGLFLLKLLFERSSFFKRKLPIIIFILGGLAILFILTILVKIEIRVSSPILLYLYFCVAILFSTKNNIPFNNKLIQLPIAIFVSFILVQKLNIIQLESHNKKINAQINQSILNSFSKNFSEKNTLIFNLPAFTITKGMPLIDLDNKGPYSIKTYDAEAMTYMESFKKILIDYSGSIEMLDFYKKVYLNTENTLLISTDEWNNLLISYMKLVYNKDIYFEKITIKNVQNELDKKNLNTYRLSVFN